MGKKSFVIFLVSFLTVSLLGACRGDGQGKGIRVVATFYPLYEAARQVGGDRVSVQNMTPAGTEPHDFEPTPRETADLLNARMVIFNGAGFEPWLERLLPELEKKGVDMVEASKNIALVESAAENDPTRKLPDPHFWLDPVLMQKVATSIKDAYARIDPAGKAIYEANAASYNARLQALDQKYQQGLQGYKKRTIIVSHAAFTYLGKRYDLDVVNIAGLSPDMEPKPQQLAAVTRLARERGVKYIFFETLVSPQLAETIAREVGAGTLVLNPLEGLTQDDIRAGKDYISVMEDNLSNLKKALEASQ